MERLTELYQKCLEKGSTNPDPTKLSALSKNQAQLAHLLMLLDAQKNGLDLKEIPYKGKCGSNGGCTYSLECIPESGRRVLAGFTS